MVLGASNSNKSAIFRGKPTEMKSTVSKENAKWIFDTETSSIYIVDKKKRRYRIFALLPLPIAATLFVVARSISVQMDRKAMGKNLHAFLSFCITPAIHPTTQ